MSEMVERVAKALMSVNDAHPGQEHWSGEWEDRARAAIEAMREPTDKMIVEAMIKPLLSIAEAGGVLEQGRAAARIEWQAMIDAALS